MPYQSPLPLSTGSTSLGALCSMADATFSRLVSPNDRFPSFAMIQLIMVLPSWVLAFPMLSSLQCPKLSSIPSHQALMALALL